MTYASILEAYGYERFWADARAAGATSLIVADLPLEAAPELPRVQLVAPTSTSERIALAAERTDGWLYLVSLTGTTGARDERLLAARRPRRAGASRHGRAAARRLRHRDAGAGGRGRRARRRRRRREPGGPGRRRVGRRTGSATTSPRSAPPLDELAVPAA